MAVSGLRTADRSDDVFIAIVIDVRKGYAVSFVQLARAGRSCNVNKGFSFLVEQQDVGEQRGIRGTSRAEIHIRITVVVHIAEVRPHRHEDLIEPGLFGHVPESTVPKVPI